MGARASRITCLTIVFWTVYLDTGQRKHQSSASLAFVRGTHRRTVNFPHKWPVTRKMFPFDDVIMSIPWWVQQVDYQHNVVFFTFPLCNEYHKWTINVMSWFQSCQALWSASVLPCLMLNVSTRELFNENYDQWIFHAISVKQKYVSFFSVLHWIAHHFLLDNQQRSCNCLSSAYRVMLKENTPLRSIKIRDIMIGLFNSSHVALHYWYSRTRKHLRDMEFWTFWRE